ncbi:sensor histidine kinase [Pedobacter duraquae]|uniref:histidine kinase n=1 Tax=Pedobacter duraquae TaxID=425511 RepID=A0A4R6IGP8_9SPHI|nr:HAMP domain-containing sensor histidine kinase [Pedobacter duraquae]TDO20867.1 phospho-acceptor domain-containing protein [Pedobacter duraquae]
MREQFIAILGHDLRNPVAAIQNVAQLMLRMPEDNRVQRLGRILQNSSLRMREMIENILDFARGRLGEGISLTLTEQPTIEYLEIVIAEIELAWPQSTIIKEFNLHQHIKVDARRISQLFSNLLSNALHHGDSSKPVTVSAGIIDDSFQLSVTNYGEPIPSEFLADLFKPFSKGKNQHGKHGLGLGLFIASEIAHAHNGSLNVSSAAGTITFRLEIPVILS